MPPRRGPWSYFDENGFPHGTGERVYRYESGEIMLRERYVDGRPAGAEEQQAARQASEPAVPDHPLRERFIGRWQSEGETVLVIEARSDGGVVIRTPGATPWESVINNVRFEGEVLCYDEYVYLDEMPGHPYSGVRNAIALTLTGDPDRLKLAVSVSAFPEPIEGELVRAAAQQERPGVPVRRANNRTAALRAASSKAGGLEHGSPAAARADRRSRPLRSPASGGAAILEAGRESTARPGCRSPAPSF